MGWCAEPTRVHARLPWRAPSGRPLRGRANGLSCPLVDHPAGQPDGTARRAAAKRRGTGAPSQSHPLSRSVLGLHQTVGPSNDPPNAPAGQRTDEPQARPEGVRAKDGPHQSHPLSRSVLGRHQPVSPPYDPPHAPPGACPWSALPHWSPPQNSGRTSRGLAPKSRSGLWHPQVPAPPRRTHPGSSTPSLAHPQKTPPKRGFSYRSPPP